MGNGEHLEPLAAAECGINAEWAYGLPDAPSSDVCSGLTGGTLCRSARLEAGRTQVQVLSPSEGVPRIEWRACRKPRAVGAWSPWPGVLVRLEHLAAQDETGLAPQQETIDAQTGAGAEA